MWLACGSNSSGVLATGDLEDRASFVECCIPNGADLVCGGIHACALIQAIEGVRVPYFCGSNQHGQLGLQSRDDAFVTSPAPVLDPRLRISARFIACGWTHSAILANDGALFTCGANEDGQLGLGHVGAVTDWHQVPDLPSVSSLACGGSHTVALSMDGRTLFAWGRNRRDELSLSRRGDYPSNPPPSKQRSPARVQGLSEWLGSLDGDGVDLTPTIISALACGRAFTAALLSDGRLLTFGENKYGQCGRGPRATMADTNSAAILHKPGVGVNHRASFIKRVGPVNLAAGYNHATARVVASSISCGWSHAAALCTAYHSGGVQTVDVITWGRADMGQLGRSVAAAPLSASLPASDASAGSNCADAPSFDWTPRRVGLSLLHGEPLPSAPFQPSAVSCGSEHTLVLGSCGCVASCGWNEHGNLGLGAPGGNSSVLTRVPGLGCVDVSGSECAARQRAVAIAAGGAASFVRVAR